LKQKKKDPLQGSHNITAVHGTQHYCKCMARTVLHHLHQHWHHTLPDSVLLACAVARSKPAEDQHCL
jgi:hypothetical protein